MKKHCTDNSHCHDQKPQNTGFPFGFFECCLKDEPAPLPPKIQDLRAALPTSNLEEINIKPGEKFQVSGDMIIADLLLNFPQIKTYLEDLHPLGMLSPQLDRISLEIFFSDQDQDLGVICDRLNKIINQHQSSHE